MLYNVTEDPTIQGGTTADALQNAPGVDVDIEGNITLRGVSGVEIWINNQPSRLSEESLKQYIQTLPANSLERIEVITNPSARYSATGDGGIINIITNKKIKQNSFVSFGVSANSKPDVSPWVSYVWSKNKWSINLYGYFGYYYLKSHAHGYSTMFNDNKDTSNYQSFTKDVKDKNLSGGIWFDASCQIDSTNYLEFWWASYGGGFYPQYQETNYRKEFNENIEYQYNSELTPDSYWTNAYYGIWYQHQFKKEGHNLYAQLGGSHGVRSEKEQLDRIFSMPNNMERHTLYKSFGYDFIGYGQVDYELPYIKNGEIDLGVRYYHAFNTGTYGTDTLVSDGIYQLDSVRYCDRRLIAPNPSAYFTIQHTFGNFTIKGGFRTEYIYLNSVIYNSRKDDFNKGQWGFFPSLHLSYRTQSMHNFKLSYTRRVNPSLWSISTFTQYGEDSFEKANPDLLPTYTNSVEAGWAKYFEKFGNVSIDGYFKNSTDEVNTLTDVAYDDYYGRIVTYTMLVNSGKSLRTGGELRVMYRLKDFMQIRFYGSVDYMKSEIEIMEHSVPFTNITESFSYRLSLNYWAKLWKVLEVNASANYRSRNKTLFFDYDPTYSIDLGLRTDLLKRKISVFVNVKDLFNWNQRNNNVNNPFYIAYNSTKYNSRFISAGITFRLGKMELESNVKKQGASDGNEQM